MMPTTLSTFALLLQCSDSSFPLGGFAFSGGLEGAARADMIGDASVLHNHLHYAMRQILTCELALARQAFLAMKKGFDDPELLNCFYEADAIYWTDIQRKSSLSQGRALLRLFPMLGFSDLEKSLLILFESKEGQPHCAPLWGCLAAAGEWSERDLGSLLLHTALRDALAALMRLGIVGPTAAQEIHSEISMTMVSELETFLSGLVPRVSRSHLAGEVAQAVHPYLYSRMFQN